MKERASNNLVKVTAFLPLFVHTCAHRQARNSSAVINSLRGLSRKGGREEDEPYEKPSQTTRVRTRRRVSNSSRIEVEGCNWREMCALQIFRPSKKMRLPRWRWSEWSIIDRATFLYAFSSRSNGIKRDVICRRRPRPVAVTHYVAVNYRARCEMKTRAETINRYLRSARINTEAIPSMRWHVLNDHMF